MKELKNNEVDALLRSLAKRRGDAPVQPRSGTGNMTVSDHLDADELNSYAEGVVPAPARARYTEHLAECDSCRGLVVSLSQSAGPVGVSAPEPRAESNFWQKLSTLFSPVVLRYAVPALMLTVVIGVGFFVMRQQQLQSEFVAQNKTLEQPAAPTAVTDREPEKQPDAKSQPSATASNEQPNRGVLKPELDALQNRPVTQPEPTGGLFLGKAPAAKDEAKAGEDDSTVSDYAMQPKAAPAPPPGFGLRDVDKAAEVAKEAPAKREDNSLSRDGFIQRQEEHGPQRSRSNTTGSVAGAGRNSNIMSQRGPSDNAKNKQNVYVETRAVAGRYFTREGNVWVDTEYNPARATIQVTRGSDQFRALVADEPGIRTVSEQLGGAVIVVWKGRAYRIQ